MKKLLLILLCLPLIFSCGETDNLDREITLSMLLYDNYTGKGTYRTWNFSAFYTGEKYYKQEFDDNLPEWSKYVGEFKNGRKHGQGTYSRFSYEYKGEWKEGVQDGKGEANFITSEQRYEESIVREINSKPSEVIRYKHNGCKYIGRFKEGLFHGQGQMIYPLGSDTRVTEGLWYQGVFLFECVNGDNFLKEITDEMKENGYTGEASYIYSKDSLYPSVSDALYIGEFKNGRKHGKGFLWIKEDNLIYIGEFKDDMAHGEVFRRNW